MPFEDVTTFKHSLRLYIAIHSQPFQITLHLSSTYSYSYHIMSSGVTEVAAMPLRAGSNVRDPSTPEGRIVQDALATVSGQPGCQRVYFGVEEEDLSLMRWFLDWDSVDDHKKFMASE